jgi:hypothetical protein
VSPTYSDAVSALDAIDARVLTVYSGESGDTGYGHCEAISTDTNAVLSGEPLVYQISNTGSGLDTAIVDAVDTLVTAVPMDISTSVRDEDGDGFDATTFIERTAPNEEGGIADPADSSLVCVGGLPVEDKDDDGVMDVFDEVEPGTPVCFDIMPVEENDSVPEQEEPQIFLAHVDVIGGDSTYLSTRQVYFLVPPTVPLN